MADTTAPTIAPSRTGGRAWFVATILFSAFLLFLVQPMVARIALPRVGGAPAVWNSAMLVYQALLLGGYAYADALGRLSPRRQGQLHLGLLLLAALTLPIGLLDWSVPAGGNIFLWVPWLFLASIGPLFFVMSAHAPLIQRWYAVRGHGDPYPLYAASNAGSFLGLAAYPLLVEPFVDVTVQRAGWSLAYGLLVLLVAGCALSLPRVQASAAAAPSSPAPGWKTMARWALLAAVPSGLIMSTTLHLTTDIVAMPLLWVLPLGLYLLSFSFAFAESRRVARLAVVLAPFALLLWASGTFSNAILPQGALLGVALGGLFLVSTALHGRLYDSRPEPAQLTRFYFVMSAGGVLGGLFAALLAPMVFDWTYEHPILLLAAALLLVRGANPVPVLARLWADRDPARLARWMLVAALGLLAVLVLAPPSKPLGMGIVVLLLLIGSAAVGRPRLLAAMIAITMLASGGIEKLALTAEPGRMTRSFFGVYAVMDGPDQTRMLVHGTTNHGVQLMGSPARERLTTAYFAPQSGIGLAMAAKASMFAAPRVAVVGLGAGTLACYARPGERWTYFEIDPAITDIARDEQHFRFLSRCTPGVRVVSGDARLTLADEPSASAEMLVIDAFSSDSVPMHLLTREALRGYQRVVAPGGLLMVHISNRFLDLRPVLAAATLDGWKAQVRLYRPDASAIASNHAKPSLWVAMARDQAVLDRLSATSPPGSWARLEPTAGFAPWTDDHSTILPLIKWRP